MLLSWCALFRGWGMDREPKQKILKRCPCVTSSPSIWLSLFCWSLQSRNRSVATVLWIPKYLFPFLKQQGACIEETRTFAWCCLAWSSDSYMPRCTVFVRGYVKIWNGRKCEREFIIWVIQADEEKLWVLSKPSRAVDRAKDIAVQPPESICTIRLTKEKRRSLLSPL